MANKTPKARPPGQKLEISSPFKFAHLTHFETARQSPDGCRSPVPNPAHSGGLGRKLQNYENSQEAALEQMLRRIVQAELEPIKSLLNQIVASQHPGIDLLTNTCPEITVTVLQNTTGDMDAPEPGHMNSGTGEDHDSVFKVEDTLNDQDYVNFDTIREFREQNCVKRTSLSNPTYDELPEREDTIVDANTEGLVDEGLSTPEPTPTVEARIKKPIPSPRLQTIRKKYRTEPVGLDGKPPLIKRNKGFYKVPINERECLANALQANIEHILDNLIFKESELPDQLLEDSCVTDVECSEIRKRGFKDQIRILISIIKGRDLCVLKKFLRNIETSNKEIADRINKTFEDNKKLRKSCGSRCPCCDLKATVDIKYVADSLWGIRAIGDGLYREIIESEKHAGSQDDMWKRLIDSVNNIKKKEERKQSYSCLVNVISNKKYTYIANSIDRAVTNDNPITCSCVCPFNRADSLSINSKASSVSPNSSIHEREYSTDLRESFK